MSIYVLLILIPEYVEPTNNKCSIAVYFYWSTILAILSNNFIESFVFYGFL